MANMYMVSCRREFWSANDFSTADEIRHLDLTGNGQAPPVTPATFLAAMAGKRVTVLVHGYNNEQQDVLDSYRTIDEQMRLLGFLGRANAPYDALIGFAWPGGASGVSFPFARGRAEDAAPRLRQLLASLQGSGAIVDINSHSLGAHVTFEALRDATANVVRYAWNFASAVDNESVEKGERYYSAAQRCQKFYVFHSKNDPVLRVWYRIGDFFDFDTALGYSGPEDPRAIMDHSTQRHGHQLQRRRVVARWLSIDRPGVVIHAAGTGDARHRTVRDAREEQRNAQRGLPGERWNDLEARGPAELPHAPADDVAEEAVG